MTVSSETAKSGPYTGNGVTTVFAYGFRILDAAHIEVIRTVAGTASTVSPGEYTVSGVGDLAGGNVTFTVAPAAGQTITIIRNAPFTQQTDLENQGAYYAETIEEALDLAAMRDQQMVEELTRAVKLPVGADPSGLAALTEDLIRLSDSADEIDTVAGIAADVTTVAGLTAEIAALPGQLSDAQAAAATAVAALDSFDDRYLGAKAVAPTVDNDGNALLVGAVYWDTVSNQMFTWTGSEWLPTFVSGSAVRALVTATGGQTAVTVPTYIVGANTIQVYLNGLKVMVSSDYTETNQNTITFLSGLTAGDEVEAIVLQPYAIGTTGAESITTEYGVTLARLLELRDGTVADLLADTTLTYSGVAAGEIVEANGFRYQVAASGASDQHVTTAGGVKLYVRAGDNGANVKAFGAVGDGVSDDTVELQAAINAFDAVYLPDGEYRISSPLVIGKGQVLRGAGTFATTIKKYGTSVVSITGDGRGYTQNLNVNAVIISREAVNPYDADGVHLSDFSIDSDAATAATAPYGILAFRMVNSVIENIQMDNVFNGIEAQTIDYTGIGVTQTGTGNNLDAFLLKITNVVIRPFNIGFSVGTTSTLLDRCYSNGGVVGYKIGGNYMTALNCACDGASDISYWNTGRTSFLGCGQEGATGNQLRDDGTAWVDGWTVTNSDSVTVITAYNVAAWSATRALTAGDAAYRVIFSEGRTSFKNAEFAYTKAYVSTAGNPFKNKALEFENVVFLSAADNAIKVPARFYTTGSDGTDYHKNYTVYANPNDTDPWTRSTDYNNGTYPSVGTYSIIDQGSMYLIEASVDISSYGWSSTPVRLVLEVPDANFLLGLNAKLRFNSSNPFDVAGFPNWTQLPKATTYTDLGANKRGSRWRTIDFISDGAGLTFDYVGGYDPYDGCIYMYKRSTGAQMKFNSAGIATSWKLTGWLPKIML